MLKNQHMRSLPLSAHKEKTKRKAWLFEVKSSMTSAGCTLASFYTVIGIDRVGFLCLYLPLQNVVPSPVYPWLQKQALFDPFRALHVASWWHESQMSERLHGSIRLESHAVETKERVSFTPTLKVVGLNHVMVLWRLNEALDKLSSSSPLTVLTCFSSDHMRSTQKSI